MTWQSAGLSLSWMVWFVSYRPVILCRAVAAAQPFLMVRLSGKS
ncbi:hypothetical protein [Acidovorax sp. NB1]|nr:hypothetical protein [Acidovorax sp. NB1]